MNKAYTEQIEELFNSNVTSYSIGKAILPSDYKGNYATFADNYRKGKAKLENMALSSAEKLIKFWEEKKMEAYNELKGFLDDEATGGVKDFDVTGLESGTVVYVDGYYDDKFVLSQNELDIDHKDVYMVDYLNTEIYVYKIA